MAEKADKKASGYVAQTGVDYRGRDGKPKRVEVGDRCDDLPSTALPWLLTQGHVKKAED